MQYVGKLVTNLELYRTANKAQFCILRDYASVLGTETFLRVYFVIRSLWQHYSIKNDCKRGCKSSLALSSIWLVHIGLRQQRQKLAAEIAWLKAAFLLDNSFYPSSRHIFSVFHDQVVAKGFSFLKTLNPFLLKLQLAFYIHFYDLEIEWKRTLLCSFNASVILWVNSCVLEFFWIAGW